MDMRERPSRARWLWIAPTLVLFELIGQIDKVNIAVLLADVRFLRDLDLIGQPARAGLLMTAFFVGYGTGQFLWGFLVDAIGPRRAAFASVLLWSAITGTCGFATRVGHLYVARLALGLSEGGFWPIANGYIARWFPVREHARMHSVWLSGWQLGQAVTPLLVTSLLTVTDWRGVFFALSLLSLSPLILIGFFAPDDPRRSRRANEAERAFIAAGRAEEVLMIAQRSGVGAILRDGRFWLVTTIHMLGVIALYGLTTWIPTYVTQVRGFSLSSMGKWLALAYLLPIGVLLLFGHVADRTMRRALVGAVGSILGAVFVLGAIAIPVRALAILFLVLAAAPPAIMGAMNVSLIQTFISRSYIGRATGMCVGIANFLGSVGPGIVGYLLGLFGGSYWIAFGFISVVYILMSTLYLLLSRVMEEQEWAVAVQRA
jgi:MFS family permease